MKALIMMTLISWVNLGFPTEIKDAPLEWLISSTIASKTDADGHIHRDKIIEDIFNNIHYDRALDEVILSSTLETFNLRNELITYLENENQTLRKKPDNYYRKWKQEKQPSKKVKLYRVRTKNTPQGYYYFNHVHTDISQDNADLKFLKYTPKETFWMVENFLKNRSEKGVVAFCDHDTDRAFDKVTGLNHSRLKPLRAIEWGGDHHMSLVGIKANWDLLDQGRNFRGRDSIIKSRSSKGFRIVNHPFRRSPHFDFNDWLDADGVEVWNTILEGAPFTMFNIRRSKNRKALTHWADALANDLKYTAVAGSDFHFAIPCLRDRTLIYPVNFIPGIDHGEAKESLHAGKSSFLTRPSAPKLTLTVQHNDQTANMGENLAASGNVNVSLFGDFSDINKPFGGICYNIIKKFHRAFTFWKKSIWEIRFYNKSKELIAKKYINPKDYSSHRHFKAELNVNIHGSDLVRAEIWEINSKSKTVDLIAATNPIYFN